MTTELELIKRRYKKARAKADLWIALLEACYHYTVPSRNLFYWTSQYQGAQKNARVYDTTAVAGVKNFVAKIQSGLCPPQQCWFSLEAGPFIREENKEEINLKLQEITNIIYYYLRKSNFDLVINECFYDLAIGTGCLLCNPGPDDDNPLEFFSVPLARVAIEETATNKLETVFRWWDEIRISDIQELWPNAKLTQQVLELFNEDENATLKDLVEGTIFDYKSKTYHYVVFYENAFFLNEIMHHSPWVVFRWSKINNEIYGRGPVIEALPSILSLNELARLELASANFNVSKPFMAYSDGVFNPWTFKIEPNTVIPVSPNSAGQWPIQPFPDSANPQFMQLTSVDLRQQINKLLFSDPLTPVQGPTRTATELALRQRNLAEEIGPLFTRLQQEFLAPIIDKVMHVLAKRGLMEKVNIDGKAIQLVYKSPLVVSQGEQDVQQVLRYFQSLQMMQGQAASINLKPTTLGTWIGDKMGIDPSIRVSEQELQEQMQKDNEEQAFMMSQGMNNERQSANPQPIAGAV